MSSTGKPNWSDAGRFCDLIAGESDPFVTIQVFDDKGEHPERAAHRHGRLSDKKLRAWLAGKNKQGCGVFVTVNQTDGYGRRRENVVAARANWADFDGTALPGEWPIKPHIITETSPGKFQAFFLIEPATDLNAASDNQARLAAYFGSDPKIIDPPRVCRLPGFDHHKGQPFRSRIVESVEPDAVRFDRLSLEEIAAAHPCDYSKPSRRSNEGRSEEPEGGWDNEMDVLRARDYLRTAPPSIEGQFGNNNAFQVACRLNDLGISPGLSLELMLEEWNDRCEPPWDVEELERIIRNATKYKANSAGADSSANAFDDEESEPDDASPEKPDTAKPKKSGRVIQDWVRIIGAKLFVHEDGQQMYDADMFRADFGYLTPKSDLITNINRGKVGIRKFNSLVFIPKGDTVVKVNGKECFNIWRPSGLTPAAGDHQWFLDHVAYVIPNERERDLVLDYMAQLIQHPEVKIHFALLVQSDEGIGKGAIGAAMQSMIGARNCVQPANTEIIDPAYTAWQEGVQLAIINELMAMGRWDVLNRLKSPIADSELRIHKKFGTPYTIPNHLNFMCWTNHKDAIPISATDRRWLVIFSPARQKEPAYYDTLFENIRSEAKLAAVMDYLMKRKITMNPKAPAPMTEAKRDMRVLSLTDFEAVLRERFEARAKPFHLDLVRIEDIMESLPDSVRRQRNVHATVLKFLSEIQAQKQARYTKGATGPAWQLWSIANHGYWESLGGSGRNRAYQNDLSEFG